MEKVIRWNIFGVGVDFPQKEGYSPTIMNLMGIDVLAGDSEAVSDSVTGGTEHGGELGALDGVPHDGCVDGADVCGFWGFAVAQVLDKGEELEDVSGVVVDR